MEVITTPVTELQTERADIQAEIATDALIDLPQPNRTYLGLLEVVHGTTPPTGQLSGGTNNPFKGTILSKPSLKSEVVDDFVAAQSLQLQQGSTSFNTLPPSRWNVST